MTDREYWTKKLKDAERELDAATSRTALNAATRQLMLARRQLKQLEAMCAHLANMSPG
jgi:hypothetical protein